MIKIVEKRQVDGITNSQILAEVEVNDLGEMASKMALVRAELDVWENSRVEAEKYRQTQVAAEQMIFSAETEELSPRQSDQFDDLVGRLPEAERADFRKRMEIANGLRSERDAERNHKPFNFGRRGGVEF